MSTSTVTSPVRLIMVTTENNNKVYSMTPSGNGEFLAEWGRVGGPLATKSYPMSKWDSIYREKVKKGYKDVTHLVKATTKKSGYQPIQEPAVDKLFNTLLTYARRSVTENYTISSDAVTAAQVNEAQGFVDQLTALASIGTDKDPINKLLVELYMVIPRRMAKVQDHLLKNAVANDTVLQEFRTIIDGEQKTLDVMAGQVKLAGADVDEDDGAPIKTILDALGLLVTLASPQDIDIVRKHMAGDARELKSVYVVTHPTTRNKYEGHVATAAVPKTELFWHGSRNENWISILESGLKIRPSNAVLSGSMFGHGIYFADKYRKSAGYTSLRGARWTGGGSSTAFLAMMDVHVGKQFSILHHSSECYSYSEQVLRKKGNYDSVFAKGGADLINNEYIVYSDKQSTIKYLVEVGT